jgi:hypothetical protein
MLAPETVFICCQREAEGFGKDVQFHSVITFICVEDNVIEEQSAFSESDKNCPLSFLATVGTMAFKNMDGKINNRFSTTACEGKERITVVAGPSGVSIRLHKGNGRLPPVDLTKPFLKKCRNRECNNLGGQLGKPRSIYCSKRCQSREQNLRQGRIKNVRSPTPTGLSGSKRNGSPRSSPSPISMLGTSSPISMSASTSTGMRMTPSPISLNQDQSGSSYSTSFSPIPMSSSIPSSNHMSTPILLPRPTQPNIQTTQFVKTVSSAKSTLSNGSLSSPFTPATSQQRKFENLTLAPILSSNS